MNKKLILSIVFAILVYLALSLYADIPKLTDALTKFDYTIIPLVLLLTSLNYFFRFWKWDYYLQSLGININKKDSLGVFLSGLSMAITPGKLGEAFKSYVLKKLKGINISKTAPIVFAERSTDLLGLLFLALISYSALSFSYSIHILGLVFIGLIVVIFTIQSKTIMEKILGLDFLPYHDKIKDAYETSYSLFQLRPLMISTVLSIFSWSFEGIALFFILEGFGIDPSIFTSIFAFAFSTIAGAVTMLPGGLGAAEGSLSGILIFSGIDKSFSVAATILIRFFTLWFGVIIGLITLTWYGIDIDHDLGPDSSTKS